MTRQSLAIPSLRSVGPIVRCRDKEREEGRRESRPCRSLHNFAEMCVPDRLQGRLQERHEGIEQSKSEGELHN
jgi:hypothetical protein